MMFMERGSLLGTGKEAEVYEYGELVLKQWKADASKASAFREAATLAILEDLGVHAPRVRSVGEFEGRWGLVMTRSEGRTFGEAIVQEPALIPAYLTVLAATHHEIHEHGGVGLPSLKARLHRDIKRATQLDELQRRRLLSGLHRLPDGDRLCHGDFHPWNVLGSPAPVTVIDWLDACCGDPLADVCRSYVLIHPHDSGLAMAYLDAYADGNRAAILDWLPYVAAARLSEGIHDEVDGLLKMIASSSPD